MTEGKYIITLDGTVKMFEKTRIHAFQVCSCTEKDCPERVVSAGYFRTINGKIETYGESTTLNVKSRPEDAILLNNQPQ